MRVARGSLMFGSAAAAAAAAAVQLNFNSRFYEWMEPECYLPLDVLFLQDTTESFEDDLLSIRPQIPNMVKLIRESHPNSYFGVAEFKDKPFDPFGYPEDYCYRLAAPLSDDNFAFADAYDHLYASGGRDYPESQYQGIITSFQYDQVGWRPMGSGDGEAGARLIIISTDALPHYEGETNQGALPDWCVPNDGQTTQTNVTYDCYNKRYPTVDQVGAAVAAAPHQYVAILTPDDDPNVVGGWTWVNEDLFKQPTAFYQFIKNDSSDFIIGVLNAIAEVTKTACKTSTTTVPSSSMRTTAVTTQTTSSTMSMIGDTTTTTVPTTESRPTTQTTSSTMSMIGDTTTTTLPTTASGPTTMTTNTGTSSGETSTYSTTISPRVETTLPNPCQCPCVLPPCPSHCGCNDHVILKVSGKPSHIEMDIEYKNQSRV